MATVKSNEKFMVVSVGRNVVAFNFDSTKVVNLECDLKKFSANCNKRSENSSNLDETVFLPCCDISKCGEWFVFSYKKCLLLWKTADWTLISYAELQRAPCKLLFSSDASKIIIVDKGGDVFSFFRDNLSQEGSFLLGHLALLFDVIITPDEKFIISCDRDDHIRVSCYPNAYNIKSYCLGHEEFVTSLNILPHCSMVLISVSGDRTLRLWDFKNGKQLLNYNCFHDIDIKYVDLDENIPVSESVAIIKCESFPIDSNESVVCIMCDNYRGCLLYCIKGSPENITCDKLQVINFPFVPCNIYINNNVLWVVSSTNKFELCALQWNGNDKRFDNLNNETIKSAINIVNKALANYECNFNNKISILYKKNYDELPEFNKRKYDSLDESSKKNKTVSV